MTPDQTAEVVRRLRLNCNDIHAAIEFAIADISTATATAQAIEYSAPVVTWPFASNDAHPGSELDAAHWNSAPVICVPRYAPFEPLTEIGHRILVAEGGLWLECRRPWLHLIWPMAGKRVPVALPYGALVAQCTLAFERLDQADLRVFTTRARNKMPNETGAWMSWEHYDGNGTPGRLVWEDTDDITATPRSLTYERPQETDTHSPCIDFHSHGALPAGFTSIDDADDAGEVKIAVVVGNVDKPVPSIAARLCCLGITIPLAVDVARVFE